MRGSRRCRAGNQQKVVIARWHAHPARVLLLDEPFQGVDIGARDDIIRAIRDEAATRATVVFVSDHEEALEVADRIVVMDRHAIVDDQPRHAMNLARAACGDDVRVAVAAIVPGGIGVTGPGRVPYATAHAAIRPTP